MEPENINQPAPQEVVEPTTKHPVFCVTSVSKYLAMALFIILPFLGGYIGYMSAPEMVVEVEKVVEVKKEVNDELGFENNIGTLTTIRTSDNKRTQNGIAVKDYEFDNGSYKTNFSFSSRQIAFKDDYDPGSDSNFYRLTVYENQKVMSEPLLRYYIHGEGVLVGNVDGKSLFSENDGSFQVEGVDVEIEGQQWELLGAFERCDVGGCDTADYIYTKIIDRYRQYILADIPLHQSGEISSDLKFFLQSLKFNLD